MKLTIYPRSGVDGFKNPIILEHPTIRYNYNNATFLFYKTDLSTESCCAGYMLERGDYWKLEK